MERFVNFSPGHIVVRNGYASIRPLIDNGTDRAGYVDQSSAADPWPC